MTVVDSRSGKLVRVGDQVDYGGGESWRLLDVVDHFFSASATVKTRVGDEWFVQSVPLRVRFLHPAFLFKRVGFFPS